MKMSFEVVTTDRTRDESSTLSFPTLETAMASREEFFPCMKETVKEKEKFIGKRIQREREKGYKTTKTFHVFNPFKLSF